MGAVIRSLGWIVDRLIDVFCVVVLLAIVPFAVALAPICIAIDWVLGRYGKWGR